MKKRNDTASRKKAQANLFVIILIILMIIVLIIIIWNLLSILLEANASYTETYTRGIHVTAGIESVEPNISDPTGNTVLVKIAMGPQGAINRTSQKTIKKSIKFPVDIVFVIDDTGSMQPQIDQVKLMISNFAEKIAETGVENRLALVSFKDYPEGPSGTCGPGEYLAKNYLFSDGLFTTDLNEFNDSLYTLQAIGAGDEPEASLTAIMNATALLDATLPKTKKIIILLTNYPPHARGCNLTYSSQTSKTNNFYSYDIPSSTISFLQSFPDANSIVNNNFFSGDKMVWKENRFNGRYDIFMYDLSSGTESRITSDPSQHDRPSVFGNRIVWDDIRNGNNDIYMCDLSGRTTDITTWCNNTMPLGGLKQITTNPLQQSYPKISGEYIIWIDNRDGYEDIYFYNLSDNAGIDRKLFPTTYLKSNSNPPSISGDLVIWQDRNNPVNTYLFNISSGIVKIIGTNKFSPIIDGSKIVWNNYSYPNYDIYLYDINTNSETKVFSGATKYSVSGDNIVYVIKQFNPILEYYDIFYYLYNIPTGNKIMLPINLSTFLLKIEHSDPVISGNKITWFQIEWDGERREGRGTFANCYHGPETIEQVKNYLISKNITLYYINREQGLCFNYEDRDMAIATGGKFYDYSQPLQVGDIILQIGEDINEIISQSGDYQEQQFDYVKVVVYNETASYSSNIYEQFNALEVRKFPVPTGGLTNINKVEIYLVLITDEGGEVLRILDKWTGPPVNPA